MTTRFTKEQLATWADVLIEETLSDISISRTDAHAESFRAQLELLQIACEALKSAPAHEATDWQVDEAVARMEGEGDMVLVPRGVLGAASGAIRHPGHEAGVILGLLRHYSFRKQPEPVVRPVMFIDGDISAADAEKLATIIREWDNEPVADVVAWSHPQHPKQTCNIRWRRFDVAPGPLFTAPPATANEARQNRDLVMMVKVLARTVRKYNAGSQQAKDFLAYLERECLVSSTDCLRIDAKDPE